MHVGAKRKEIQTCSGTRSGSSIHPYRAHGLCPYGERKWGHCLRQKLFELEELIRVDTRAFATLLDLARAEGAAGDGMAEERVLGSVGSSLHTCGGRVRYSIGPGGGEGRGQRGGYACFCKRGMRG